MIVRIRSNTNSSAYYSFDGIIVGDFIILQGWLLVGSLLSEKVGMNRCITPIDQEISNSIDK